MSVDIDKLRALHAATTQGEWTWLRAYASGAHVVASGNTGVADVLSRENPVHGWHAAGQAKCDANAAFIAAIHESVLPLCDRVERAEAEVERLRTTRPASDMDIEKLRALCAEATPHPLTLEPGSHGRWRITVTVDGHTAEIAHGNDYHHEDGPLFAKAREIILAMCDRVERADAEIERLRAENARLAGELAALRGTARPAGGPGRCTVCGWPLAESRDKGCVDGDCWYRPWGGA